MKARSPSSPKVLIAPNAFKGSLTAFAAAKEIARGVLHVFPKAKIDLMPISDGGDGLMEVLLRHFSGKIIRRRVTGPLDKPRRASYALLDDGKTAVIEMAQASGIAGLKKRELDPLKATSYGTGELLRDALRRGARNIIVGMGGSATNDGGAGMAGALGVRFLDSRGRALACGAQALGQLAHVDVSAIERKAAGASVVAVSDVVNPLLGRLGSARVYGPQKGATPAMVRVIDRALARYADVLRKDLGCDIANVPGSGAAGGLGAGLLAFLRAEIVPGADWVLNILGADRRIRRADLVLTGEGKFDRQSFFGKAPIALALRARRHKVPVAFLCGRIGRGVPPSLKTYGIKKMYSLTHKGEDPMHAMKDVRARLCLAAKQAARAIPAVLLLMLTVFSVKVFAAAQAAPADPFAEADNLYFHRNAGDNLQKSVSALQEIASRDPKDSQAMWRLARSGMRLGENETKKKDKLRFFEQSEKQLRRSIELDPNNPNSHYWLGITLGRIGQTRGILKSLFLISPIRQEMNKTLELDPHHAGAHHVLGEMLRQIPGFAGGSKKGAVKEFETAMELDPNFMVNYPVLAQAYLDIGEKEKAKAVLHKFFEVKEPGDPGEYDDNLRDARNILKKLGETPPR